MFDGKSLVYLNNISLGLNKWTRNSMLCIIIIMIGISHWSFENYLVKIAIVRMTADGRLPEESRRNYKHVFDALIKIRREEGIKGLWRGTVATVFRAMTANVTQLMSYDAAKKYLMETSKTASKGSYRYKSLTTKLYINFNYVSIWVWEFIYLPMSYSL